MELDVQVEAVPQWLAARRKLPKSWAANATRMRARTRDVLAAGGEFAQLVRGASTQAAGGGEGDEPPYAALETAFDQLLEALRARGEASRALLGGFANAELRRADSLLQEWRADRLFLVPLARRLHQLVGYEL
jgi:hypothetical protein